MISEKSTSSWGGRRKLPRAFTEQGIYMLMTVLKGELAISQSKALIRTFRAMKNYIIENQDLLGQRQFLQLSMISSQNTKDIMDIRKNLDKVENQMADVVSSLGEVVTHSELATVMVDFGNPKIRKEYLVLMKSVPAGIGIVLFSDNLQNGLHSTVSVFEAQMTIGCLVCNKDGRYQLLCFAI